MGGWDGLMLGRVTGHPARPVYPRTGRSHAPMTRWPAWLTGIARLHATIGRQPTRPAPVLSALTVSMGRAGNTVLAEVDAEVDGLLESLNPALEVFVGVILGVMVILTYLSASTPSLRGGAASVAAG